MKKRYFRTTISLVLAIVLTFGFAANAFAATVTPTTGKELVEVRKGTDTFSKKTYNLNTEFDGIRKSADNFYAMEVDTPDGKDVVPVGKLTINLASPESVKTALSNEGVAPEIKKDLLEKHQMFTNEPNANFGNSEVVLFSTELLPKDNTSKSQTPITTYSEYNGARMRTDILYYTGLNTQYRTVAQGKSTAQTASSIVNIALVCAGFAEQAVLNFFLNSLSLLQAFINEFGPEWATGSTSDHLQVRLIFDSTIKYTYREVGSNWYLGLCTQKVNITNIASEQYYYNGNSGKTFTYDRDVSKVYKSPHFDSPDATAYQWYNSTKTEWLSWQCGSVMFSFI